MPKVTTGFFSFTEVTDPAEHHSYNEWHQLDHMPEQFPLAGIAYGQRWVWPPARRTSSQVHGSALATPPFDRVHYVTLYLMQEPLDETLTEFLEWGKELGRRGRFHRHRTAHLSGPFSLVETRAATRVLVSAEAVPYRPHRGIRVVVEPAELASSEPTDPSALCDVEGVAGVWQFETDPRFDAHVWNTGGRRITVAWIDGGLDATSVRLSALDRAGVDLSATLETITPWQWDWFDRA